jgi:hypothetical protein
MADVDICRLAPHFNGDLQPVSAPSYVAGQRGITCHVIGWGISRAQDSSLTTEGDPMEHALANAQPARAVTLRQWLVVDTLTCLVFGLLLLAATASLSELLGLPRSLLFYAGVILFPCAALMALAAKTLAKPLASTVIAGNLAWVVASVGVVSMFDVTTLGLAFVLAQAAAVLALAMLEWRAR